MSNPGMQIEPSIPSKAARHCLEGAALAKEEGMPIVFLFYLLVSILVSTSTFSLASLS